MVPHLRVIKSMDGVSQEYIDDANIIPVLAKRQVLLWSAKLRRTNTQQVYVVVNDYQEER